LCFYFDYFRGYDWLRFLMWNVFKCATLHPLLGKLCSFSHELLMILFMFLLYCVLIITFICRGPSNLATFVAVYALFGPTFPGIYDKDRGVYTLFYPVCAWKMQLWWYLFLCNLLGFDDQVVLCWFFRVCHLLFRFPASIQIVFMVEKVMYCNLDKRI